MPVIAGINECLERSVKRKELYDVLAKNIKSDILEKNVKRENGKLTEAEIQSFKKRAKRLNILIAEDDQTSQFLISKIMEINGIKHKIVENGKEAVECAVNDEYNIILMDINMPVMDGIEATKQIRENEKLTGRHIPIVAVTAQAFKEDIKECFGAGMDDYMNKPIKKDELYKIIEKNADCKDGDEVTYNFDEVIKQVGDRDTFNQVVKIFLQDLPDHIGNIKKSIESKNNEDLWKSAHKLKGALAIFGKDGVCKTALNLEILGKQAELQKAADAFIMLQDGIDKLKKRLTDFTKETI